MPFFLETRLNDPQYYPYIPYYGRRKADSVGQQETNSENDAVRRGGFYFFNSHVNLWKLR